MQKIKTIEQLEARYPEFFRDVYCGNFCPEAWLPLVDKLCGLLQHHMKHRGDPLNFLEVSQVKEKYGGLRFYYHYSGTSTNVEGYIRGVVDLAESLSYHIK